MRAAMAADSARRRESLEHQLHPVVILSYVWMNLGVGAFQIRMRIQRRAPMTGAGDIDDACVGLLDQAIQMHIYEVLAGRGAPVAQEPGFDVIDRERLSEQRIVSQVNLAHGQEVGSSPIAIHLLYKRGGKWSGGGLGLLLCISDFAGFNSAGNCGVKDKHIRTPRQVFCATSSSALT